MSVGITPLGDYILAQQEEAENKTASGLYLPDKAQEKPKIAKVIAVGPGKVGDDNERIPVDVKVGQRIIFKSEYSTTTVKHADKEYLLIKEEDVLATVK